MSSEDRSKPPYIPTAVSEGQGHPYGWLFAVRIVSIVFSGLITILFLSKIPPYFIYMRDTCLETECGYTVITPLPADVQQQLGLSATGFAAVYTLVMLLMFAIYFSVALLILIKRPREPISFIGAVALIALPATTFMKMQWREFGWLTETIDSTAFVSFILFLLLFPNGKIAGKRMFYAAVGIMLIKLIAGLFPEQPWGLGQWPMWCNFAWFILQYGTIIYSQYYRYRYMAGAVERQQTKWVVYGLLLAITSVFLISVVPLLFQADFYEVREPLWMFVLDVGVQLFMIPIPVTLGISMLRKKLWDIDPIVSRTLVYISLSAVIIILYSVTVWYLSILFQTGQNMIFSLFAAGVVAVLFAPLKDKLQRLVNRMLYGEQYDPFSVLVKLGNRLKESLSPEAALETVVKTVKDSLRVPYAAIGLEQNGAGEPLLVASAGEGERPPHTTPIPLTAGGGTVGTLHIAARSPGEAFTEADHKLIGALARQAGIVVQSVKQAMDIRLLVSDLQESKEQLIFAREEERRSMRKNLHDDIAPRLAAMRLTASLVTDWIRKDPDKAIDIMSQFKQDIGDTVEEIRGIVYDLRPPALDELGLIGAIRQRIEQLHNIQVVKEITDSVPLHITLDAPERLPMLPAAIEVGAYRIATEALVNVVKHARSDSCRVRIAMQPSVHGDELIVEVRDNGIGLQDTNAKSEGTVGGLGLTSLRERAQELGGTSVIESVPNEGTCVFARLPIKASSNQGGNDGADE